MKSEAVTGFMTPLATGYMKSGAAIGFMIPPVTGSMKSEATTGFTIHMVTGRTKCDDHGKRRAFRFGLPGTVPGKVISTIP